MHSILQNNTAIIATLRKRRVYIMQNFTENMKNPIMLHNAAYFYFEEGMLKKLLKIHLLKKQKNVFMQLFISCDISKKSAKSSRVINCIESS